MEKIEGVTPRSEVPLSPARSSRHLGRVSPQQAIVNSLLESVEWESASCGSCECPGFHLHTILSGDRAKVYLDGVPTVFCLHQSCKEVVADVNRRLRSSIGKGRTGVPFAPSRGTRARASRLSDRKLREQHIAKRAEALLPAILRTFAWPCGEITAASPVPPERRVAEHWRQLLSLFDSDDIVWIGEPYDSGKPRHRWNFRRVADWLKETAAYGTYICPAMFREGGHCRRKDSLVGRRFLVVESDKADPRVRQKLTEKQTLSPADRQQNKDACGALIRWLRDAVRLDLVAVVDSAGKSLHGWFRMPTDPVFNKLKEVLPHLQCDPALFNPTQPVRLPGVRRDHTWQRLLYFNPNA